MDEKLGSELLSIRHVFVEYAKYARHMNSAGVVKCISTVHSSCDMTQRREPPLKFALSIRNLNLFRVQCYATLLRTKKHEETAVLIVLFGPTGPVAASQITAQCPVN